jgi:hypothetical protein
MKPSAEFLSHEGTAADSVHDEFVIPHQLCEQCRPIAANLRAYAEQVEEKGLDAPEVVYEHYDSISGLADSARQGCTFFMVSNLMLLVLRGFCSRTDRNKQLLILNLVSRSFVLYLVRSLGNLEWRDRISQSRNDRRRQRRASCYHRPLND